MKNLFLLMLVVIPTFLFAQEKEPCNVIFVEHLYFKNIKFRDEKSCQFDEKLYLLKKDSIRIKDDKKNKVQDVGKVSKYSKEKYWITNNRKIVFFVTNSRPQLFIAELFKDSLVVLEELNTEMDDDLRNYDYSYGISYEFYLQDLNQDKKPELIIILADEGGGFRIKVYEMQINAQKLSLTRVFRSEHMLNYYNESYCEGPQCKYIQIKNNKVFVKYTNWEANSNEDFNLRQYEKLALLKFNIKGKNYEILK